MARSIAAQTATAIRKELKTIFPNIRFRVTSDNFSGGNAVRIHWVDGPSNEQIRELTDKYEYGHFDGMIDMYEYSNVRDDIPQVKYVTLQRRMDKNTELNLYRQGHTYTTVNREFWKMDLSHVPTTDDQWAELTRY